MNQTLGTFAFVLALIALLVWDLYGAMRERVEPSEFGTTTTQIQITTTQPSMFQPPSQAAYPGDPQNTSAP